MSKPHGLTEKESSLYDALVIGMDSAGSGWLHELSNYDDRTNSGIVSSLVKKGLIRSDYDDECDAYWLTLIK